MKANFCGSLSGEGLLCFSPRESWLGLQQGLWGYKRCVVLIMNPGPGKTNGQVNEATVGKYTAPILLVMQGCATWKASEAGPVTQTLAVSHSLFSPVLQTTSQHSQWLCAGRSYFSCLYISSFLVLCSLFILRHAAAVMVSVVIWVLQMGTGVSVPLWEASLHLMCLFLMFWAICSGSSYTQNFWAGAYGSYPVVVPYFESFSHKVCLLCYDI